MILLNIQFKKSRQEYSFDKIIHSNLNQSTHLIKSFIPIGNINHSLRGQWKRTRRIGQRGPALPKRKALLFIFHKNGALFWFYSMTPSIVRREYSFKVLTQSRRIRDNYSKNSFTWRKKRWSDCSFNKNIHLFWREIPYRMPLLPRGWRDRSQIVFLPSYHQVAVGRRRKEEEYINNTCPESI